jgi:hypothetical protein
VGGIGKADLQQILGREDASDGLFAAHDPDINHGPQRRTLTHTNAPHVAQILKTIGNAISDVHRMPECFVATDVVHLLMVAMLASVEYQDLLANYDT